MKIRGFYRFKLLGDFILQKKPNVDTFCSTNISSTMITFFNIIYPKTRVFVQERYWYPFIWVFIITYVDKGTSKVPILTKIGVCVQGSTSKIWNSPTIISPSCEVVYFYNFNCRLNILVDGSWSIRDLEAKVF